MKMRKLTALAVTAAFGVIITLGSATRADAHRGWGWGIGAGIATAVILGGIYHHRHHRYYYRGYPNYGYRYSRPHYYYGSRRYYRPRYYLGGYRYYGYRPRWRDLGR